MSEAPYLLLAGGASDGDEPLDGCCSGNPASPLAMKTYRTRVVLIAEVAAANERQAYEKSSNVMERLREHLHLALEETRVVLSSQSLRPPGPEAGGRR